MRQDLEDLREVGECLLGLPYRAEYACSNAKSRTVIRLKLQRAIQIGQCQTGVAGSGIKVTARSIHAGVSRGQLDSTRIMFEGRGPHRGGSAAPMTMLIFAKPSARASARWQ